jgi:Recombination endonuclease VII
MAKKHEFHEDFSKLPATGVRARELGETLYFTGKRCAKGHLSTRYASSGNCSTCIAIHRGNVEINHKGKSSKRSSENQSRAISAFELGLLEYKPDSPCPHGHYRRYVTTNNCIDCDVEKRLKMSEKIRWSRVQKLYGLSELNVAQMLDKQNCQCVICSINIKIGYHIDHCHSTGKVRGLLCQKCNQAIGLLRESESLFFRAAEYIKEHNATTS